MNNKEKIKRGLDTELNVEENYNPPEASMVGETYNKVEQLVSGSLIKSHLNGYFKNQTLFAYTDKNPQGELGRSTNYFLVDGPTERISSFVDNFLQPIMKEQHLFLKDTTHFINFRGESSEN